MGDRPASHTSDAFGAMLCAVESGRPSGTVTFLFTDVENSTEWWDQHPGPMRVALERHDGILERAVTAHGGFVFSRGGDGVAVAFQRAGDAVAAAIEEQRALVGEGWPPGVDLRVRMGLHTGEADERDGDDFGPPLNRAARLMGAAHGGQILMSATEDRTAPRSPASTRGASCPH